MKGQTRTDHGSVNHAHYLRRCIEDLHHLFGAGDLAWIRMKPTIVHHVCSDYMKLLGLYSNFGESTGQPEISDKCRYHIRRFLPWMVHCLGD